MAESGSPAGRHWLRFTTERPVTIIMVVLAVVVFGLVSLERLSLNLMPDITYPSLTIRTEYPGAAPEEVENNISRPIEQAVGVVNHLVEASSISRTGLSDVILEYGWGTDMNEATQEVREKLETLFLPREAGKPLLLRYDPTLDPIMRLGFYGDASLFALREQAEQEVKRALEGIDGVAAVKVQGGLEREIRIDLSEETVRQLGLNINAIQGRLAQENINVAGGAIDEGDTTYLVRTLNEFRDLDEIRNLVVGDVGERPIRVRDVGTVAETHKEREVISRIDGLESVGIDIFKEADANIVTVANAVKEELFGSEAYQRRKAAEERRKAAGEEEKPKDRKRGRGGGHGGMADFEEEEKPLVTKLPAGMQIKVTSDQSIFIRNSLKEVFLTAVEGGLLAIFVLFVFLRRLGTTGVIGISIPIALVATFAAMHLFDVSLNIMSLGGLALGMGMLVDNSIVVLEAITRRREQGETHRWSAVTGTSEVAGAITASTLTTICVFLPIIFVEGIAGQIFGDLALTVVFSLLVSLAAAVFLIPMLVSRKLRADRPPAEPDPASRPGEAAAPDRPADLFRLDSYRRFRRLFRAPEPKAARPGTGKPTSRLVEIVLYPLIAGWECLVRQPVRLVLLLGIILGITLLMAVGTALCSAYVLACTVGGIVTYPIYRWRVRTGKTALLDPARAASVARIARWGRSSLAERLGWPEGIRLTAWEDFLGRLHALLRRVFRERPWWKTALLFLPGTIGVGLAVYLLFQLALFQLVLALIGRVLLIGITLLLGIGFYLFSLLGLVLYPLIVALAWPFRLLLQWLYRVYPPLLDGVLRARGVVIVGAFLLLGLAILLLPSLGSELLPELHQGEFYADLELPVGTPLADTDRYARLLEGIALETSDVAQVATNVGVEKESLAELEKGENTARLALLVDREGDLIATEERVLAGLRTAFAEIPQASVKFSKPTLFSFKTPVEVQVYGYDLADLRKTAEQVETRMAGIPGLYDVRSSLQRGNPEIHIVYDRDKLSLLNLNLAEVANIVRNKVQGTVATRFRDREQRIDILLRVQEEDKDSVSDLRRLVINPGGPVALPLAAVARLQVNEGPSEIRRVDQRRAAVVTANVAGIDLGHVTQRIRGALADIPRPEEVEFALAGQNREFQTSARSLRFALLLAVFLVYVVMASQFESLLHPFIIIFCIPLAFIGVILTMYLLQIPLSVVVLIGVIVLTGIAVNDAIVLVDYTNQLQGRGLALGEAVREAGRVRLRPILMTTFTTILGLLPMALGLGEGAEIRTPIAIAVIAGLVSSTALTLLVIPAVYLTVETWRARLTGLRRGRA